MNDPNIEVTEDGLVEKSTGRKILSPLDVCDKIRDAVNRVHSENVAVHKCLTDTLVEDDPILLTHQKLLSSSEELHRIVNSQ